MSPRLQRIARFALPALLSSGAALAQVGSIAAPGVAIGGPASAVRAFGPSPSSLSIARVDLKTGAQDAATLSGIDLLPLFVAGSTPASDVADATAARIVDVGGGEVALQLPTSRAIRVFHYVRGTTFGFFSVYGDGQVRVLIERGGLGATGALDPFDRAVAASSDGRTLAIASADYKQGIGGLGDTWLIRADASLLANGASLRELTGPGDDEEVPGTSLRFRNGGLYAVLEERLVKAPADGSAGFAPLALPLPPTHAVVEEFAVSGDGATLAFLAGVDEAHVDLWLLDAADHATQLTNAPGAIQPPGYLPADTGGPHLALNFDGSQIAFDREIAGGHELFVRATAPGSPELQVTSDAYFEHSIDTVSGILSGGAFVKFFAGSSPIDADLYRVSQTIGSAPLLENVTKTSGTVAPFFPNTATIAVTKALVGAGARIFADPQASTFDLWRVSASDVAAKVATGLVAAPEYALPGVDAKAALVLADGGAQDQLLLASLSDGEAAIAPLLALPSGVRASAPALSDGSRVAAFAADFGGSDRYVVLKTLKTGALAIAGGTTYADASGLLFSRGNRLLFTAESSPGMRSTYAVNPLTAAVKPAGAAATAAFWLR